jgi:hypothetical protein
MNKTCTKCGATFDADMQACMKCEQAESVVSPLKFTSRVKEKMGMGCFAKLLVFYLMCTLIVALLETFFPSRAMLCANMNVVSEKGSHIYWAISARDCLGDLAWPVASLAGTTQTNDASGLTCKTSTEYFEAMLKIENEAATNRLRLATDFNYSILAGVGVPACRPGHVLTAANNMWIIAGNITESDDKRIPVLLTRNLDVKEIERVVNQGLKKDEFKKRITFSDIYKEPFFIRAFVAVRRDGSTLRIRVSRKTTLGDLFDNKEFPPRDPSKPPIVYLMP